MACKVKYNTDGSIKRVLTEDGKDSKLFKDIYGLPILQSLEDALETYKNKYSKAFKKEDKPIYIRRDIGGDSVYMQAVKDGKNKVVSLEDIPKGEEVIEEPDFDENVLQSTSKEEPNLVFISDRGNIFSSYKNALNNSTGGDIAIHLDSVETEPIITVSSNSNPSTIQGFINYAVKADILSDKRVIDNGKVYFKPVGNSEEAQVVNAAVVENEFGPNLGPTSIKVHPDRKIELFDEKGKIKIGGEDYTFERLSKMNRVELIQKLGKDNADIVSINRGVKEEYNRVYGNQEVKPEAESYSESELVQNLLDILNKMGVEVKSISDYIRSYNIRHGVDPSAPALADIANQVVALKDGEINLEDLTEETAHFIVEAWPEQEVERLIRNIDRTREWTENNNYYREKYKEQGFEGESLERLVRKEILGKVLAKNLISNFNTKNRTESEVNIFRKLISLIKGFIDKVNKVFSPQSQRDLEDFTERVQQILDSKDSNNLLNTDQFGNKKFALYSNRGRQPKKRAPLESYLSNLVDTLLEQEKDLLRADKGLRSNVKKLKEIQDSIVDAKTSKDILDLIRSSERQATYINKAAENANKKGILLSNEETVVFNSLENVMEPTLVDIEATVKNSNIERKKDILSEIGKALKTVRETKGLVKTKENLIFDKVVDRVIERQNLTEEYRDSIEKALKSAEKDTSAFYATFGSLTHASDPLLNLAGSKILDMQLEANISFVSRVKDFQKRIKDLGFKEKDLKQLYDNDGYILSQYDWAKFEKTISKIEAETLIEVTGSDLTVEEINKIKRDPNSTSKDLPQLETEEQRLEYSSKIREKKSPLVESIFKDEYYKKKQDKYDRYSISKETQKELGYLSLDRGTLLQRVKTEDGYPRYTSQDKVDLEAISLKRKSLKDIRDDSGEYKKGLIVRDTSEPDYIGEAVFINNGKKYTLIKNHSKEARMAFDINKLDASFQQENTNLNFDSLSQKFLNTLEKIEEEEGREAAIEYFQLNASINFSSDFWDNLGSTKSFKDRAKDYRNTAEDLEFNSTYDRYTENSSKRSGLLKKYKDPKDSTNYLANSMPSEVQEQIRELDETLMADYIEMFSKLSTPEESDAEKRKNLTENTLNKAYYDFLQDNRIESLKDKTNFTKKHIPNDKKRTVEILSDFVDKGLNSIPTKYIEIIEDVYGVEDIRDLTEQEIQEAPLKYAQANIAQYYKAFAPKGFRETYNKLYDSDTKVFDVAKQLDNDPNTKITNNFLFYDTDINEDKNPYFKENFEGGRYQPKLSQFKNSKFENLFEPVYNQKGEVESVRRNKKLYELYEGVLDFQRSNLKAINEKGNVNLWQAPQISKTSLDKVVSLLSQKGRGRTLKDAWKDFTNYRVDELAEGQEKGGKSVYKMTGMRFIPKYYTSKLESAKDVSDDLFYSLSAMAQQSELYKSRKKHYSEIMSIEEALLKRNYPDGKSAESTQTMKMFRSFIDNNLFGVREQATLKVDLPVLGKVDIAKIARQLHSWLRLKNLGFNFVIPLTSWLTGEATYAVETYIGEYVNRTSAGKAKREMRKHGLESIKETGGVNSKGRLNLIGEHYNFFDFTDRTKDSKFKNIFRNFPKIGMFLHTAANFPINTRVALNVMMDHRIVDKEIMSYNEFKSYMKKKDSSLSSKDIKKEWKGLENETFYDQIITKNGKVEFDYEDIAAKLGRKDGSEFREWFKNIENKVSSRALKIVERVDTQIRPEERSAATRHFLLNFLTTHRNYLWLQFAYRFKNKHISLQTGRQEEGTYRSLVNFITRNLNKGVNNRFKGFYRQVIEDYNKADNQLERGNIRRTLLEIGSLQALVGVGFLISAMADDEENKDIYALQLGAYETDRVIKEMTSAYTGTVGELYDAVKSPVIGADFLKDVFSLHKFLDSEHIEYGKYKGLQKNQRHALKVVPGIKNVHDMMSADNIRKTRQVYNLYNKDNVEVMNPLYWFLNSE